MLGYAADQLPATIERWRSLLHPEDHQRTFEQQQIYFRRDEPWEVEFRMRRAEGDYYWILSRGKVVDRNAEGNPLRAVGVHVNITEKKLRQKLEEESLVKAELLRGIIRVSLSSLNVYNFISKRLVYSGKRIYQQLGYLEEEFGQLSEDLFAELLHPDDRDVLRNQLTQLSQAGGDEVFECVFRLRNKAGHYHWVQLRDSVFSRDQEGMPTQVIGSVMDITRYRELQDRLKDNIRFLEELSVANSHNLRGPVATILGLINVIKVQVDSPLLGQEMVDYLEKTVIQLDKVINQFNGMIQRQIKASRGK